MMMFRDISMSVFPSSPLVCCHWLFLIQFWLCNTLDVILDWNIGLVAEQYFMLLDQLKAPAVVYSVLNFHKKFMSRLFH